MSWRAVTPGDVDGCIVAEHYFTAADGVAGNAWRTVSDARADKPAQPLELLTICVLVTRNGHTVLGEAYCQDPAVFDAEVGRKWARADAFKKLFPMVVYAAR
jgi:hypothetical protein